LSDGLVRLAGVTTQTPPPETPASRLLLTERDALLPILRERAAADFDRPTLLPGWSVRDVLAHCAAALGMAAAGRFHGFSPAENQVDVDERRDWPIERLLDELAGGYTGGAAAIAAAGGQLDGIALGEWVHGGDVRDAWGIADAYASAGIEGALRLTAERSRLRASYPATRVTLGDHEPLDLGVGEPAAALETDAATFVRLVAGRSPDPTRYTLTGVEPELLLMFR